LKRSNQLVIESAVVASILVALAFGGSVATTTIPPSFAHFQNPVLVKESHDLPALATYYNATLTKIGTGNFAGASFLLDTFPFVNIPPSVNATAQAANSDLAAVNTTAAGATALFQRADLAVSVKQYVNAKTLANEGCALAEQANASLADFQGPQTTRFKAESVPTGLYSEGAAVAEGAVQALLAKCSALQGALGTGGPSGSGSSGSSGGASLVLIIGSPQTAIETGGPVKLVGNLTLQGAGVAKQEVLFYLDGSYFGEVATGSGGDLAGALQIPFVYTQTVLVQAFVAPNSTLGTGGASSNPLVFDVLFNQTAIAIGDPPAVLPTFSFGVHGNLTTVNGVPLPGAPVKVTFFGESQVLRTDSQGAFGTRLTVPGNASDGLYDVYASFAPEGVFGPSVNFTTIRVVHLPMVLTIHAPPLSLAGLLTTLTGTASSNGSAIANATVRVGSPWGSLTTKTDVSGDFTVTLGVSPLDFAFARDVTVSGTAPQPYVALGTITESIALFNVLIIILPVAAVGIVVYEADKLGAFEGLRGRKKGELETQLAEAQAAPERRHAPGVEEGPEILQLYRRALSLASAKYSLGFAPSQTIREVISEVAAKEKGREVEAFSGVLLTLEDFLYAADFDESRLKEARRSVAGLEEAWG
jgi:hypothetical protein